jgi:hypothetical protein
MLNSSTIFNFLNLQGVIFSLQFENLRKKRSWAQVGLGLVASSTLPALVLRTRRHLHRLMLFGVPLPVWDDENTTIVFTQA